MLPADHPSLLAHLHDGDPALQLNASLMVFLPKGEASVTPDGDLYYDPGNTRPLNIVNTDNRILCNAVRLRLEPLLGPAVHPAQLGCSSLGVKCWRTSWTWTRP